MIRTRSTAIAIGAAIALGALAPAASARSADEFLQSGQKGSGMAQSDAAPLVPSPSAGGFDWGDAGIGAGGALVLTIAGMGGAAALRNSQRRGRGRTRSAISGS